MLRAYYEDAGYHLVGYRNLTTTERAITDTEPGDTALYEMTFTD